MATRQQVHNGLTTVGLTLAYLYHVVPDIWHHAVLLTAGVMLVLMIINNLQDEFEHKDGKNITSSE